MLEARIEARKFLNQLSQQRKAEQYQKAISKYFEERGENEAYRDYVRRVTEGILLTEPLDFELPGTFSVHKNKVKPWINQHTYLRKCNWFSEELSGLLMAREIDNQIVDIVPPYAAWDEALIHEYIVTTDNEEEIVIDPTLGQFLIGHNHFFVGTKEELRAIIVNQTGESGPYVADFPVLPGFPNGGPLEAFEFLYNNPLAPCNPSHCVRELPFL